MKKLIPTFIIVPFLILACGQGPRPADFSDGQAEFSDNFPVVFKKAEPKDFVHLEYDKNRLAEIGDYLESLDRKSLDEFDPKDCQGLSLSNWASLESLPKNMYSGFNLDHLTNDDMKIKYRNFYCMAIPNLIQVNYEVLVERSKIYELKRKSTFNDEDLKFLKATFSKYNLKVENENYKLNDFIELLDRVDIVPLSISLGQMAYEGGWGSSKFAQKCKNTFGLKGEVENHPAECIDHEGYKFLVFDSILDNARAYLHRINSGSNYYKYFRDRRRQLRIKKRKNPILLTKGLINYAETRTEYTNYLIDHFLNDADRSTQIFDGIFQFRKDKATETNGLEKSTDLNTQE
ncbi:MAG: glucosaminidase domain-containing protein [Bdellovibrionales bacterium]